MFPGQVWIFDNRDAVKPKGPWGFTSWAADAAMPHVFFFFLEATGHTFEQLRFFSEASKVDDPISTTAVIFPKESDTAAPWGNDF